MDQLKDYEGLYWINRLGVITNKNNLTLKVGMNYKGYKIVGLTKNGKQKQVKIHRLLAIQYIPNNYNKPQVDHIDRNRKNNSLDNLRWASASENCINRDYTNNKSGVQNIFFSENRWVFKIHRNKITHKKRFKSMEEAIEYKTQYLKTTPAGPSSTVLMWTQ